MTKRTLRHIYDVITLFGFNPRTMINTLRGIPQLISDYRKLKKQRGTNSDFPFGFLYPISGDRYLEAGTMSGHYFHQDLFVARKIFLANPKRHIDIGSRTDGFVSHVAAFRVIEILDIRDMKSTVENINFRQADLMQLPKDLIECCDSISTLHAIEHFGLGRYGDPIDYNGHVKALENITTMLIAGGTLYFSTPIGRQRIEFNAHRVFSVKYLLDYFNESYTLQNFSYVDDAGNLHKDVDCTDANILSNFGCTYGCGIFELQKK